ncbi:unnamed protein product [Cochlearia groenlandica]
MDFVEVTCTLQVYEMGLPSVVSDVSQGTEVYEMGLPSFVSDVLQGTDVCVSGGCIKSEYGDPRNQKKGSWESLSDLRFDHGTRFVALHGSINVVDSDQNLNGESAQSADRTFIEVFDDFSNESECSSTIKVNIKAR